MSKTSKNKDKNENAEDVRGEDQKYNLSSKGVFEEMENWMQVKSDVKNPKDEEVILNISRMVSLGQLSATIIHELKQPLNSMSVGLSTLELLLQDEQYDRSAVSRVLRSMKNQVMQSSDLILTMSDFNRGHVIGSTGIDLTEILGSVLMIIEKELQKVGITVDMQIQRNVPPIYGEKVKLQQLFVNLLLNAKDAIEEKRERMEMCDLGKIIIDASYEKKSKEICIQVKDNGIGIKKKDQEKIFSPFFSTKAKGKGTGLGMVIIKRIVEQHEGRIDMESHYEKGTNFKVYLPSQKL